ncbi:hypothetical protein HMPREF1092_00615 [Clostridium thermobutyricum]|uniref:Uncharacterized protein n=1 Tax=Clostridium thermobutyricum TaxID=29372 RepID=N9XUN8_9CLOT|nr:hypothetical protein [Clostridium thermobutyricum]ENZ03428.1 hypothetical protein HMPREF1092_00615 [Clostridium thermobutyricum]
MDEILRELFSGEEIPQKSLDRILKAEEIINNVELENQKLVQNIEKNEINISFFANDKKLGITRKSIYLDKYLLKFLNYRIKNKKDYLNVNKIEKLEKNIEDLNEEYYKVIDNIIDVFDLRMQSETYQKTIEELLEENKKLRNVVKEKQITINNLNNELKSYKIIKLR